MNEVTINSSGEEQPRHLKEVISIIPESCYDNPAWKGLWYVFRDLAMYFTIIVVLLSTNNIFYLIPLWIVAGLIVSSLFVIGHDAAHRALFKKKWLCDLVGRVTMLPSLHIYSAWILGHNRIHHGFTVHQERDFVWHPYSPEEYKKFSRMKKLMHRLEWSFFGAGIYYLVEVWWKKMIAFSAPAKWVREINRDRRFLIGGVLLGILGYYLYALFSKDLSGGMTLAYAGWIVLKVMVIPWFIFNYCIGATVYLHHINPQLKWHAHESWTKFKAQMEGTMNFRIYPRVLNIFLHNIMLHVPHHVDMRIPFYNLEKASKLIQDQYPDIVRDMPVRLRDYFRTTRLCKLYDFESETWMNYRGKSANLQTTP